MCPMACPSDSDGCAAFVPVAVGFPEYHSKECQLAFVFRSEGSFSTCLFENHVFTSNSNVQPGKSVKYTYL